MQKQKESNFQTLPAMSGAVPCTASMSASPLSPILPLEKEENEKKARPNQSIKSLRTTIVFFMPNKEQ
jgi:hypothetical protein